MSLAGRHPGDRVKLDDDRIVELAWPTWPFTLDPDKKKLGKGGAPPDGWFAREIVDLFGGEARGDLEWMPAVTEVAAVLRDRAAEAGTGTAAKPGRGDADPLNGAARGVLL